MRRFKIMITLVVFLVIGCHARTVGDEASLDLDMHRLGTADPVADLNLALKNGDRRFIGLRDLGEFVPGAEDHPQLTEKMGIRYVPGSSDTADKRLQDPAQEYAQIYNMLLVRVLRKAPTTNP